MHRAPSTRVDILQPGAEYGIPRSLPHRTGDVRVMIDLPPQDPPAEVRSAIRGVTCAGETISRIDFVRHAPSPANAAERALAATTEAAGLDAERTSSTVLLAYVRLKPRTRCLERDRRDSERMLRQQPYVASAAVTAIPDGAGRVRIRIDVVNEFPWIINGRLGTGGIAAVRAGTLDLDARGLTAVGSVERGGALRPGFGVELAQYGFARRPAVAALQLERRPLGGILALSIAQPFLSDGQRYALHASLAQETEYATLVRPSGDAGVARTQRSTFDVGWVKRVGTYHRDRVVGLAGVMFLGSDIRSGGDVFVRADSGLIRTADSVLVGRFPDYGASRVAALGGLRALRFRTVERFDALRAAQDVGSGVQMNLLIAPRLFGARESSETLLAGDLYAGVGGDRSFAALTMRGEARASQLSGGRWDGVVASSRLSWHRLTSDRRTRIVSLSGASMHRLTFPAQLTLRDPDGGLIGFPDSRGAGGQRVVVRVEERRLVDWFAHRGDIAVAAFADAGRLWAGDVPYGADTPVRSSVGVSMLGAFPKGGKRVYRIDLGFPLNREPGMTSVALRFSVADRTSVLWEEPRDVARARTGVGRAALMRW